MQTDYVMRHVIMARPNQKFHAHRTFINGCLQSETAFKSTAFRFCGLVLQRVKLGYLYPVILKCLCKGKTRLSVKIAYSQCGKNRLEFDVVCNFVCQIRMQRIDRFVSQKLFHFLSLYFCVVRQKPQLSISYASV